MIEGTVSIFEQQFAKFSIHSAQTFDSMNARNMKLELSYLGHDQLEERGEFE
jgi:hypothetical protein